MVLRFTIILLLPILAGCYTPAPARMYNQTRDFSIYLADPVEIRQICARAGLGNCLACKIGDVLYVPYGNGELPAFGLLGKEVWHLEELGGRYHK